MDEWEYSNMAPWSIRGRGRGAAGSMDSGLVGLHVKGMLSGKLFTISRN